MGQNEGTQSAVASRCRSDRSNNRLSHIPGSAARCRTDQRSSDDPHVAHPYCTANAAPVYDLGVAIDNLEDHADTLELINTELTGRLARQADSSAKIDNKAIALAGYAFAAATFLATQHPQPLLAGVAFAAYALALALGIGAYAVGSHQEVPNPRVLFNRYAMRTKPETLAALAAERVKAFEANTLTHQRQARLWRLSLVALALGVTLTILSLIVHNSLHDSSARPRDPSTWSSVASGALGCKADNRLQCERGPRRLVR